MVHPQSETKVVSLQVLPAISPEDFADALQRTDVVRFASSVRSGVNHDERNVLAVALRRGGWVRLKTQAGSVHSDAFLRVTASDGDGIQMIELVEDGERDLLGLEADSVRIRMPRNVASPKVLVARLLRGQTHTVYGLMHASTKAKLLEVDRGYGWQELLDFTPGCVQDGIQDDFLGLARDWYGCGQVKLGHAFPVAHFTAGASQAMEKLLCPPFCRRLHVLEGEYEGAKEIAKAYGLAVVFHDRCDYGRALGFAYEDGDVFYVSAPSAIDGDYDPNLMAFIRRMGERHPRVKFVVDITYVGLVQKLHPLNLGACDNVEAVVFSLSKTFGVYYERIGGVFLRRPHDGFGALDWFKCKRSIVIGTELLTAALDGEDQVTRLPKTWRNYQRRAIEIHKACGLLPKDARPSNASLLALSDGPPPIGEANGFPTVSVRGNVHRYCLSGTMRRLMLEDERKQKEGK